MTERPRAGRPRGVFLGLATLDVLQYVDRAPGPDAKATSTDHALAAGGPAANAAVTFAALGGEPELVTCLGDDDAGSLVRADLIAHGAGLPALLTGGTDPAVRTPVSSITVSTATGERSIVGSDAAGAPPVMVDDDALRALLTGAGVLLLDGHYGEAAAAAARIANERGVAVVLDVGRWKPVFDVLVPLADHVVCSEGVRPPGFEGADHAESIGRLFELGARHVVVTRGGDGVLVQVSPAEAVVEVPVADVVAVDTLGAGDAFHGAYAFVVANAAANAGALSAAALAARVAAIRVQHRGPRAWLAHLGACRSRSVSTGRRGVQ